MKKLLLLSIFLLFALFAKAQDTLVKNNGIILSGFIMESDSDLISYSNTDSLSKELNLISRDELLLIKHRNGKVEKFYTCDTLITTEGDIVLCKVLELDPDMIICFSYNGKITEPVALPASAVLIIKFQDGTKELMEHEVIPNDQGDLKYYSMGIADAHKYYKVANDAIVGEVASGITTWFIFVGTIPGGVIAFTPPKNLHTLSNPNDHLLASNALYQKGFADGAKKQKMKKCGVAYLIGVLAPVATIGILVAVVQPF